MLAAIWTPPIEALDGSHQPWRANLDEYFDVKCLSISGRITAAGEAGCKVFLGPEFYFTQDLTNANCSREKNLIAFPEVRHSICPDQFQRIVDRLLAASRAYPDMLIVPGTALVRKLENNDFHCFNICPVIHNGTCLLVEKADPARVSKSETGRTPIQHPLMTSPYGGKSTLMVNPCSKELGSVHVESIRFSDSQTYRIAIAIGRYSNPDDGQAELSLTPVFGLGVPARVSHCIELISDGGEAIGWLNRPGERNRFGNRGCHFSIVQLKDHELAALRAKRIGRQLASDQNYETPMRRIYVPPTRQRLQIGP